LILSHSYVYTTRYNKERTMNEQIISTMQKIKRKTNM